MKQINLKIETIETNNQNKISQNNKKERIKKE